MVGTEEYQVVGPTATEEMQPEYTDCHTHGSDTLVLPCNHSQIIASTNTPQILCR